LKVLIVRRGGNLAGRFLEVAVYAVGGRRGIILIPEGRKGRGWSLFIVELGKVLGFFKASGRPGFVSPSSALKESGKLVETGLVQYPAINGWAGSFGKVVAPSYAVVLRPAARLSEVEKKTTQFGEPLGKDRCDTETMMGLSPSDAQHGSAVRGNFGDNLMGESKLTGNRVSHTLLWEWKCQLAKLKDEVYRALISVSEGLEMCGPCFKPKVARRKKRRKRWAQ
jgi:hypothetical protein